MVAHAGAALGRRLTGRDHDPGRNRIAIAERVPDCDRDLSRPHGAGIANFRRGQAVGGDLDHRQIAVRVVRGDDPGVLATVRQHDVDLLAVTDDVRIGDDLSVGAPDYAGAVATAAVDQHGRFPGRPRDLRNLARQRPGQHVALDRHVER